jgi:hypothetical protein
MTMPHGDIGRVGEGQEFPITGAHDDDHVRPEVRSFTPPGLNAGDLDPADQELAASPVIGDGTPDTAPALPADSWAGLATEPVTDGLSPKAVLAALAPVVAGIVLMILDLSGVVGVEDGIWLALIGAGPLAGGAAVAAKPGNVTYVRKDGGEL